MSRTLKKLGSLVIVLVYDEVQKKVFAIRKGSYYDFSKTTFFSDGYLQYTTHGLHWSDWAYYGDPSESPCQEGDLQFYFTVR